MRPTITVVDHVRISSVISELLSGFARRSPGLGNLRRRLGDAIIVEPTEIEPDRVTMNSRVVFRYKDPAEERTVRLVYPAHGNEDYDPEAVSILSPVGAALLGARKGETVSWNAPAGEMHGEVVDIIYQPEASGDPD